MLAFIIFSILGFLSFEAISAIKCHKLFYKLSKGDQNLIGYKLERKTDQMSAPYVEVALRIVRSPEFMQQLADVNDAIKLKYPSDKFFIVGIGRSPAPVIAWLQAQTPNYAINLPFSELAPASKEKVLKIYQQHLDEHFDIYFPSDQTIKDRTVVIMDYTFFGKSLAQAKLEVKKYLARAGRNIKLVTLALIGEATQLYSLTDESLTTNMVVLGPLLSQNFHHSKLKAISEYPSFITGLTDSTEFESNPLYLQLVEKYRKEQAKIRQGE